MVIRQWKGIVKPDMASIYINHLLDETFPNLSQLNGFRKAYMTKRTLLAGEEFLIITEWDSMSSIKAFAGDDVETAVVPQHAAACMISYDLKAVHYEVLHEYS